MYLFLPFAPSGFLNDATWNEIKKFWLQSVLSEDSILELPAAESMHNRAISPICFARIWDFSFYRIHWKSISFSWIFSLVSCSQHSRCRKKSILRLQETARFDRHWEVQCVTVFQVELFGNAVLLAPRIVDVRSQVQYFSDALFSIAWFLIDHARSGQGRGNVKLHQFCFTELRYLSHVEAND
jgi:hypothetical protein